MIGDAFIDIFIIFPSFHTYRFPPHFDTSMQFLLFMSPSHFEGRWFLAFIIIEFHSCRALRDFSIFCAFYALVFSFCFAVIIVCRRFAFPRSIARIASLHHAWPHGSALIAAIISDTDDFISRYSLSGSFAAGAFQDISNIVTGKYRHICFHYRIDMPFDFDLEFEFEFAEQCNSRLGVYRISGLFPAAISTAAHQI